ncbi:hypothetical protein RB195_018045 [Necator americanus]|uniref:Cilium assembly protein DZIP1 N-terminal domain-containing protein n=1 Tax=Necator americanus TaxID=51031 RepID=A0ABR1C8Y6_NECAM
MSDKNVSKDVIFEESLPNWALIDEVSVTLLESGLARFPTLQALLPSIIAFDAKSLEATQRSQKLLRISQLQIEYLLKSQHQLLQRIAKLDDELRSRRKEVKQLKESITRDDASFFRVVVLNLFETLLALMAPSSKTFPTLLTTPVNSGSGRCLVDLPSPEQHCLAALPLFRNLAFRQDVVRLFVDVIVCRTSDKRTSGMICPSSSDGEEASGHGCRRDESRSRRWLSTFPSPSNGCSLWVPENNRL